MTSLASASFINQPVEEDDGEYGFFCDEAGEAAVDSFPFATVLSNAAVDQMRVDSMSTDPIRHIAATISAGSRQDAIARPRSPKRFANSQPSSEKSLEVDVGTPTNNISSAELAEDDLIEAPVWVVAQGSNAFCDSCRCRLVYCGRNTAPGRVFSRSFVSSSRQSSGRLDSSQLSLLSRRSSGLSQGTCESHSIDGESGSSFTSGNGSMCKFGSTLRPTAAALGGFRVRAGRFGQQWAEFEIVVSSGNWVHRAWRTHADVAQLVETVGVKRKVGQMPKANLAWELVQRHNRWFSTTEMLYLIEKRSHLDVFFEHLLYELDSPTHLLNFADDNTWRRSGEPVREGECACDRTKDFSATNPDEGRPRSSTHS